MMAPNQTRRVTMTLIVGLMVAISLPTLGQSTTESKVKIVTVSQVYYPSVVKKGKKYKSPAVLTTSAIFAAIDEWKTIQKKKLSKSDAEYHLLLRKANEKFNKALKKVQAASSYDIMAEVGAITCSGCTPTDVTQTIIANLPG